VWEHVFHVEIGNDKDGSHVVSILDDVGVNS
jgi:hypothetical protein